MAVGVSAATATRASAANCHLGASKFTKLATAKAAQVSPTRFAVLDYPVHITGGTGKFDGATGDLNSIGELDFNSGVSLRYFGKVCYADADNH